MTDYGDSASGRVYERLERVIAAGIARIEGQLDQQQAVLSDLRERVVRLEERTKGISDVRSEVREIAARVDEIEKSKAWERGVAAGTGAVAGGLLGWLSHFLPQPPTGG